MNKETGLSAIYAKNITPLVKGDEVKWYRNGTWINATVKNEKVNTIYPGQLHTNKGIFSDVELSEYGVFVVSFADRPNTTGKQPVDDDVVVDDNHTRTAKAGALLWYVSCGIQIKTWKPNHAAMLAKFKEQGANTMNEQEHKAKSHEVALMTNALDDNPDEQVIEPGLEEDWVIDHLTDKPVFTQEAHKAGELPPILSKCEFNYQEDSRWPTGVVVAYYGNGVVIVDDHDVPFVKYPHELRPIDNRSDKDKVVDALRELLESLNIDSAQVSEALTDLMSDKFTITLNKD